MIIITKFRISLRLQICSSPSFSISINVNTILPIVQTKTLESTLTIFFSHAQSNPSANCSVSRYIQNPTTSTATPWSKPPSSCLKSNSLLTCAPLHTPAHLQSILHTAARVTLPKPKSLAHDTPRTSHLLLQ